MKKVLIALSTITFASTVFTAAVFAIDGHRVVDGDFPRIGTIVLSAPQLNNSIQQSLPSFTQFVSYDLEQAKLNTGKLVLRDSIFIWIGK